MLDDEDDDEGDNLMKKKGAMNVSKKEDESRSKQAAKNAQQIPLFKGSKQGLHMKKPSGGGGHTRTDSSYSDLN